MQMGIMDGSLGHDSKVFPPVTKSTGTVPVPLSLLFYTVNALGRPKINASNQKDQVLDAPLTKCHTMGLAFEG